MNKFESFALNQWLSDYPDNMGYDEIIELLEKDNWNDPSDTWQEIITPWELIEYHTGEQIAELIDDIKRSAERWFTP